MRRGLLSLSQGWSAAPGVSTLIIGAGLAGIVTLGVVVGPPEALSVGGGVASAQGVSASERETLNGLRELLASCKAVIDVRPANGSDELVLWMDDAQAPGTISEDEVLILTHAPLLGVVYALTIAPGEDGSSVMPTRALFSDELSSRWRRRDDVDRRVVATDVTAMRIERLERSAGDTRLSVSLTFDRSWSDDDVRKHADAMFVVTLPSVARTR